ncbi:MAG: hypothetical protein RML75_09865 [Cyanobacteriota bacterium SKYGB_h_bin112]|nr:hypothetical protein [Cyanobacteriota bacterium SKYGB_h_bin112]
MLKKQLKQYEEDEDYLVLRQDSGGAILVVLFLVFGLLPLAMISGLINVNLAFIVVILGLGFTVWIAYRSLTLCQLVIKRKEKVLVHECIHPLSKKKKSKLTSLSEIATIKIDISDELYGGTSEREMYEVIHVKFLLRGGEEFDSVSLKANREFRTKFSSIEQLVDRLHTFTGLTWNVFSFSPHSFFSDGG